MQESAARAAMSAQSNALQQKTSCSEEAADEEVDGCMIQ